MTAPRKPGRPIRGATATRQRAYRLDKATIAAIERLAGELGLSHAQVVRRAVEALAGDERRLALAFEAHQAHLRVSVLEEALRRMRDDAQRMLDLDPS